MEKTRTPQEDAEFWKQQVREFKQDLPDFARPEGGTRNDRLEHRWARLCEYDGEGKLVYKAYTLTGSQTARVEFMLYGLEKMTKLAFELAQQNARLKEEIAQGPQGTVDQLIAYLDPDHKHRR